MCEKNCTHCFKNTFCRQCSSQQRNFVNCNTHNVCYEALHPPCDPRISKGLVQSLKDKIICLQNESIHFKFAKRPMKKKQKDYYCLMLRKINALDKKLQHLEELFVRHLDTPDDLYRTRNSVRNNLYDSVCSLIDLTNKLKEDVNKRNSAYYNNQNNSQVYKRIQVLESELQKLSVYLEKLQNSEWRINHQNMQFDQISTGLPCNATAQTCQDRQEEAHANEIKRNPKQKRRQNIKSRRNKAQHTVAQSTNGICHSPCSRQCCNTEGYLDNTLRSNRQCWADPCDCQQIKSSPSTSTCSCDLCELYRKIHPLSITSVCSCSILRHDPLYDQKLQFTNSPTHHINFKRAFFKSKERQNSLKNVRQMLKKKESHTAPYFEENEISFQRPVETRTNYKIKQNKGRINVHKKKTMHCYSTESHSISTVRSKSKKEIKVNHLYIIDEKRQNKINDAETKNTLQGTLNKNLRLKSYYKRRPKKEMTSIETYKKQFEQNKIIPRASFKNSKEQRGRLSPKTEDNRKIDGLYMLNNNLPNNRNFKTKTFHYDKIGSPYSPSESEEISSTEKHLEQGKNYLFRREYCFSGVCKENNNFHTRRYQHEEPGKLGCYKTNDLMNQSTSRARNGDQSETIFVPFRYQQKRRNYSCIPKLVKYNTKYERKFNFLQKKYNKQFMNKSHIYESDSYETVQENDNSLNSSSDITLNTSPQELIILHKNINVSSYIRDVDEDINCNECRGINLYPPELSNCKQEVNTKILIQKGVIRCPKCTEKLEKRIFKVSNSKENEYLHSGDIVQTKNIESYKDLHPNKIHETKLYLKGCPDENRHTEVKSKNGTVLDTSEVKLEQDNLGHKSHLNDTTQNKTMEIQNFGNTININIERSTNSSDNCYEKGKKFNNMKTEKTVLFTIPNPQEHIKIVPTDQILLPENKNNDTNGIKTIFNHSNPKTYLASTINQPFAKSYSTTFELLEYPEKLNSVHIKDQTSKNVENKVKYDKPKFKKLNIIAKVKDNEEIENEQSVIRVQDSKSNTTICSKLQLIDKINNENGKKVVPEQTTQDQELSCYTVTSARDKDRGENGPVCNPTGSTQHEVLTTSPPLIEKNKSEEYQYANNKYHGKHKLKEYTTIKRSHRPLAVKRCSTSNKKFKEILSSGYKYKFDNLQASSCTIDQSNACNTGSSDNKQYEDKLLRVIKKPVDVFNDVLAQTPELVNILNLNITSDSSFSTLDWEKVANKLKVL